MRSQRNILRPGAAALLLVWGLVSAVCVLPLAPAAADNAGLADLRTAPGPYAPGEAIVRFEPGTSAAERRQMRRSTAVDFEQRLSLPRTELVEVEGSVRAAVGRLQRLPGVDYAQPNFRYQAAAVEEPDDTFFDELWGLTDPPAPNPGVSALEAWEYTRGAGQVIAIVDTGVDLTHPDLEPNLWTNPGEVGKVDGVDNDDNGKVDDVHGYDFSDGDPDPDDYNFHGTHVAGIAAAVDDNALGVAGVAPEAEIMAVRVLDGDGSAFSSEVAEGIDYAAENGADVINLSLSGPADSEDKLMSVAVDVAAKKDAVVVAAAGNEGADNDSEPSTPCALPQPNLICVAALNQNGALASFSNFGAKSVDLAAPGTHILSAKTDYGQPVFEDGFETGLGLWTPEVFNGGVLWGTSSSAGSGTQSATDSPTGDYGQAQDLEEGEAESNISTADPVDLSAERGCRIHFLTRYQTEPIFDAFAAGAVEEDVPDHFIADFEEFTGTSPDYPSFEAEEVSISELDGGASVHPIFALFSDGSTQADGAYVDDVRLICRDDADYENTIAPLDEHDALGVNVGNYVFFQGTSMATPQVSGIAALVGAALKAHTSEKASATEVAKAILDGTSALPVVNASKRTVTFGIADACQAIAVALNESVEANCPGSSENVVPPLPPSGGGSKSGSTTTSLPPRLAADTTPPSTFFSKHPPKVVRTRQARARILFRFGPDEAGVSFFCRIDGAPFRVCPPQLVRRYALGRHTIRVKARDAAGNVDATPAVYRFAVKPRG